MGHYRSEMYSDEELKEEIREEQNRLNRKAAEIKKLIDKHGLPMALAKLLEGK